MSRTTKWMAAGVAAAVLAAGAAFLLRGTGAERQRNLIIISVDTLRPDHLGCYGYERDTSSAIDSLAEDGTVFLNAYAQRALTWPSLASIMTSTYPITHGIRTNGLMLADEQPALAAVLQGQGYRCVALLANAPQQNWQGFEEVKWLYDKPLTDYAIEQIRTLRDEKFFLWLFYVAPHAPYEPPEGYGGLFDPEYTGPIDGSAETLAAIGKDRVDLSPADLNHIVSLYDGEIAFVDDQIQRVLDELRAQGLLDDSLIVFTSDHGEDMYDHNYYFDHMASVYDSSLRIPLMFRLPGTIPAGARLDPLVESIDIAPTILELLGIRAPRAFQGDSLVPLLEGRDVDLGPCFAEWQDQIVTVRTDAHRYVFNPLEWNPYWLKEHPEVTYFIDREELYDLRKDPGETTNLAAESPEVVGDLRKRIDGWIGQYDWKLNEFDANPHVIDEDLKESLEAMGYVF
ncbi:MAG: sulfatase [Candidatus Hydrogenedentes bacterium]|nr:sulfatase [Candidatus Hydrogenedentota bacterium]